MYCDILSVLKTCLPTVPCSSGSLSVAFEQRQPGNSLIGQCTRQFGTMTGCDEASVQHCDMVSKRRDWTLGADKRGFPSES